jgi:hypothetical protein
VNTTFLFTRKKSLVLLLQTSIQLSDVAQFYSTYLLDGSSNRIKFSSQFYGKDTTYEEILTNSGSDNNITNKSILINHPVIFRRSMSMMNIYDHYSALEAASV